MNSKAKAKKLVFYSHFLIYFTLFCTFEPKIFTQNIYTSLFWGLLNCFLFAFYLFQHLSLNKRFSTCATIWFCYRIYILLTSFLNLNFSDIDSWGLITIGVFNLIFLFDFTKKEDTLTLITATENYLCLLLLINAFTLLFFPRGLITSSDYAANDYYFLGIKNATLVFIFPAFASSLLHYHLTKNWKRMLFSLLLCLFNIFYHQITGAVIVFIIFVISAFIYYFFKFKLRFSYLILLALFIQISINIFNIQDIFSPVFEVLFQKDSTLSSRIYIWRAFKSIFSTQSIFSMLFGNGYILNFVPYNNGFWQPHSQLFSFLWQIGILGTIAFYYSIFLFSGGNSKRRYYFLQLWCFAFLIICAIETHAESIPFSFPFLCLKYITDDLKLQKRGKL